MAYQTEQLLKKKFFDLMLSLKSDEMIRLSFTFYVTFSNSIPKTTFVKANFSFGALLRKWQNDWCVTNWQLNYHKQPL